jgi:hypothetical protein
MPRPVTLDGDLEFLVEVNAVLTNVVNITLTVPEVQIRYGATRIVSWLNQ